MITSTSQYKIGLTPLDQYTRSEAIFAFAEEQGLTPAQAIVALVGKGLDSVKNITGEV